MLYSGYSIWDNQRVYASVDDINDKIQVYKPHGKNSENKYSFEQLRKLNPDVKAWISMDKTKIDYPILQGRTNLEYLNKDIFRDTSLAGSIFLDVGNDPNFWDNYSLIYGHHMDKRKMFGDLDLYKKKSFFEKNYTGKLILPDRKYRLEIFSLLMLESNDPVIFRPDNYKKNSSSVVSYAMSKGKYINKKIVDKNKKNNQIIALSTCSSSRDRERLVVLAYMIPIK